MDTAIHQRPSISTQVNFQNKAMFRNNSEMVEYTPDPSRIRSITYLLVKRRQLLVSSLFSTHRVQMDANSTPCRSNRLAADNKTYTERYTESGKTVRRILITESLASKLHIGIQLIMYNLVVIQLTTR